MRYVVTGAAGFIGSRLTERLRREGHYVLPLDLLGLPGVLPCDVAASGLKPWFQGIDTVFHLAATSSLPECESNPALAYVNNVVSTANVLRAAEQTGASVVLASTSAVYENNTMFGIHEETDDVDPDLVYALTKLAAERLGASFRGNYDVKVATLRYFNVYGPGCSTTRTSPPLIPYVVRELLAGRAPVLHGDGTQRRDYVYVDDVVDATHIAAGRSGLFNVASGTSVSVSEIYDLVQKCLGTSMMPEWRDWSALWNAYPALARLRRDRIARETSKTAIGDPGRAHDLLGWHATTTMEDGIRRTVDYYKSQRGAIL